MQKSGYPKSGSGSLLQTGLLLAAVAALVAVPPSFVEQLPSVCLNHRLFGWCPGCGTLRALSHLFHGDLAGAIRFNWNAILTGPVLVLLLLASLRRTLPGLRRARAGNQETG